jgi:hypothetical protein
MKFEKLGCDPDIFTRHTRSLDTNSDLSFIAIPPSTTRIHVSIPLEEVRLYSLDVTVA